MSATAPSSPAPPASTPPKDGNAYSVLRNADFTRYLISRFISSLGMQMLLTALDWEIYRRVHTGLALGLVGLTLMVPMILCTLPAGHAADTFDRKKVILAGTLALVLTSLGLMLTSAFIHLDRGARTFQICAYSLIIVIGVARTFLFPASAAFVTNLVAREELTRAITFNSGAFQLASVLGPSLAGALIWFTHVAWVVYAFNVAAGIICFALIAGIRHTHQAQTREPVTIRSLISGFHFVFQNKIILGIITLDMFAVLLGGAVTLLPIFANDIIPLPGAREGLGLGILRAAIPVGAILCVFYLAHRPPLQKAGRTMLWCVAVFGVATSLFGVANRATLGAWLPAMPDAAWFWVAFGLMALCGVVDNVSVVVRHTLVQILTPDEKRGRVSAVNSLFIGTSNELGGAESGFTAQLFGPWLGHTLATGAILSVALGGVGTVLVVLAVAWVWPDIRRYGRLA